MAEKPVRVLIVDDEEDFLEMFSLRLKEMGESVTTASSGKACLEILEREQIDVVILDILMPQMNGMETLKVIKQRFPLVEVVMLTAHGTIQTAVDCMKIGAFDYLLKPADFRDLVIKLHTGRQRKKEQEERIRKAEAEVIARTSRIR